MNRKIATIFLSLFLCSLYVSAQVSERSELEQKAEAEQESGKLTSARYTYVRAFRDYARKGQIKQGVLCGAKAAQLYYKDNDYEKLYTKPCGLCHLGYNLFISHLMTSSLKRSNS